MQNNKSCFIKSCLNKSCLNKSCLNQNQFFCSQMSQLVFSLPCYNTWVNIWLLSLVATHWLVAIVRFRSLIYLLATEEPGCTPSICSQSLCPECVIWSVRYCRQDKMWTCRQIFWKYRQYKRHSEGFIDESIKSKYILALNRFALYL